MAHLHNQEERLDMAIAAIENKLKGSGMLAPSPGFAQRWMVNLHRSQRQDERRQARILLTVNLSLVVLMLMLIGSQTLPMFGSVTGVLFRIVEWVSDLAVFLRMLGSIWGTIARTLPGVVPANWWFSVTFSFLGLLFWWGLSLRRSIAGQGA
jgi:hypothetical protein